MGSTTARQAPAASPKEASASKKPAQASSAPPTSEAPTAQALGAGRALPPTTRQRMERAFGRSFSDVSVHTGPEAESAASTHGAEALTQGSSIAFGAGRYQPGSEAGDKLIAHELAHVVQQSGGGASLQEKSLVSGPAEPAEQEADAVAARVVRGESAGLRSGGQVPTTRERLMRKALAGATLAPMVPVPVTTPAAGTAESLAEDSADSGLAEVAPSRGKREPRWPWGGAPTAERAMPPAVQAEAHERTRPAPVEGTDSRKAEANAPGGPGSAAVPVAGKEEGPRDQKATAATPRAPGAPRRAPVTPVGAGTAVRGVELTVHAAAGRLGAPSPAGTLARSTLSATPGAPTAVAAPRAVPAPAAVMPAPTALAAPQPMPAPATPTHGAPTAAAAPQAAPASAGGAVPASAGPGMEAGGAEGGAEATVTEEKMDAARPEEEAAAEALQDGEIEAGPDSDDVAAEAPTAEAPTGAAKLAPESAPLSGGAEGESVPASEPAVADAPQPAESPEDRQAREAEQAPFAEQAPSSPESASAEDAALSPGEQQAAMASLEEGTAAGGGGEAGGGGGGGGAIAEKAAPEVPDVSQAEPAQALGQVAHLPPAQLSQALSGVGQAVSRSVGEKRDELAASPPELETPTGMAARPRGLSVVPSPLPGEVARRPDKVLSSESAPVPRPEPMPAPPPAVSVPTPVLRGGEQGVMSAGDAARLGASIQGLPTSDPELSTSAGPAPLLALDGGADPGQLDAQRTEVEARIADAQVQGQAEVAQPMGEDEIAPEAAEGTLKAEVAPGGGAGAGGGVGGGEVDEAASIVAQEEHGADIQAAVLAGQGDMATEEARHAEAEEQGRQKTREEADRLSQEAAEAQRAEKDAARGEVEAAREQWSEAQRSVVEKGRTEADSKQEASRAQVRQEKERADTAASEHLESGEREAARHKREGEAKAARQKARAESESGGFLDWVADKATAFFDSIKEGIRAAIQEAREAVQRALDAARKLAREAIERARQAVVAAIREAGEALIAVGDTVLAAFPEARARFRANIEEKVRAAEETVNRLAEELQAGVQKLLDGLGELLDKALGLLEQGLLFIVDSVSAAVQGALEAAKAALETLGTFAQLIKDIAANPGQWLANLGAAVMDGLRNHLWKALKSAVAEWFNQKLEAVLGLGTTLLNLLVKGGLSIAKIGQMAWNALKEAIPPALIQLLVEKLVSMIIPAAGAVLAIIEGLQAAWGTVSRILQAMDRFIAFLKAVKTGGAGPQFANAVAAGAVAVIEFVANWLLARLRKPAGAVAGRLRAIGRKILDKLKRALKKVGQALKKAWRKLKARFKKSFKRKGKGEQKKDKRKAAEERLDKAERELRPRIAGMLQKGTPGALFQARLLAWRIQYRLSRLDVRQRGDRFNVIAVINPQRELGEGLSASDQKLLAALDELFTREGVELLRLVREITEELTRKHATQAKELATQQGTFKEREVQGRSITVDRNVPIPAVVEYIHQRGKPTEPHFRYEYGETSVRESYVPTPQQRKKMGPGGPLPDLTEGQAQVYGLGQGGRYSDIAKDLLPKMRAAGLSDAQIAQNLSLLVQTNTLLSDVSSNKELAKMFVALQHLLFVRESARTRANLAHSAMIVQLAAQGDIKDLAEAFTGASTQQQGGGALPVSFEQAAGAARRLDRVLGFEPQRGGTPATHVLELAWREYDLVVRWIHVRLRMKAKTGKLQFDGENSLDQYVKAQFTALMKDKAQLRLFIEGNLQKFYERRPPKSPPPP
ncbi:DUF4157 domain-containing protein [Cystobacter ferrugineus]|uniref:eCIS core domain-containing protein n=1 Tax=Cystobacter ferrugineus TaxID=83449 RepID=A0A1L9AWX8_9BACT|nr:DUF4157 domain-containing protein [Cystobacter ferrugineus]OJH34521.1 hypothetical protein BON30_42690 [Cystobacter ferrugineus]